MRSPRIRRRLPARMLAAPALALLLAAPLACGDADPEERLAEAGKALSEARAEVEEARARVQERKAELEEAEQDLERARKELRAAEQKLAKVEERVDVRATDAALFRSIQTRLLQDDALSSVAITARVDKGVVVLSGRVPKPELRERALSIARSTPGVAAVESRIEVEAPAAPAKKPAE